MPATDAVPFTSPESLMVEVTLPRRGVVKGMGIRQGVTLIVGGGFHGKTTLLKALEAGIYNKASALTPQQEVCHTSHTPDNLLAIGVG
jgi:predicted ABC-class ATPase